MKKLLAISLIVAGTFASAGLASAGTIYTDVGPTWASDAFGSSADN